MSTFLKTFLSVAERNHYVFTPGQWLKIIQEADKTTLLYIKNESLNNWKNFTRDWIPTNQKEEIVQLLYKRIDEIQVNEWFKEMFLHLH